MPQQSPQHRIGDAARLSGVSAANIRYYEKEGLLRPGVRGDNSYRFYSSADLHRLRFIRLCRAMDMSLDEVRRLLAIDAASDQADHRPAPRWMSTWRMCASAWPSCGCWKRSCAACAAAAMARPAIARC